MVIILVCSKGRVDLIFVVLQALQQQEQGIKVKKSETVDMVFGKGLHRKLVVMPIQPSTKKGRYCVCVCVHFCICGINVCMFVIAIPSSSQCLCPPVCSHASPNSGVCRHLSPQLSFSPSPRQCPHCLHRNHPH